MTARELTNKEKIEYNRMVRGSRQMTLNDLLKGSGKDGKGNSPFGNSPKKSLCNFLQTKFVFCGNSVSFS